MNKGENDMAVVTYTVTVTGTGPGSVTITPDISAVVFVPGDFLIFKCATQDVVVKVVGGPTIVAAVAGERRVVVGPQPQLNGDGDVLITFSDAGGLNSGFPP
jgi:hypothetical protein